MHELRWTSLEGDGIEHLTFDRSESGIVVESAVVGQRYGRAYGLAYRVECDPQWRAKYAVLRVMGGGRLELHGDGAGRWRDGAGRELRELDGCVDIDIAATPFTNSLPIGRLRLARGERRPIDVAYVSTPDLTVTPVKQAYTCIEPGRRYRYEGIFRNFTAEMDIDADGLVIDYETLFKRLPSLR
ncbi:putative glycolipid-binding domain-containing protein [Burkholderia sp. AU28942]|uniref:putative glycolipid-binding domain-containing protein n=1 Tax=Burkholderia TaxID=32008 RepID=UPI0008413889|nr:MULTISPECIES: putative glycolipid-binding domain-containing protein [Burkholderia]AOK07850.1 transcriptional regulator [Burkholderia latens]MCA8307605.1 putative glycolipid-binding domain-containing protein [Burkholderia sp. AU28942]